MRDLLHARPHAVLVALQASANANPGIINPWLINRGVSPFGWDSSLLEGTTPLIMRVFNPGSTLRFG